MTCDGMIHRLKSLIGQLGTIPADRMDDEDRAAQRDMLHWSRCYHQRVNAIRTSVTGSNGNEKVSHNPTHLNAAFDEVRSFCDQVASMLAAGMAQTA
jgi:hypothetical protein